MALFVNLPTTGLSNHIHIPVISLTNLLSDITLTKKRGLFYAKVYNVWHCSKFIITLCIFRIGLARKFPESTGKCIPVLEPASCGQFIQRQPGRATTLYQVFTIPDAILVDIVGKPQSHALMNVDRQLPGGDLQVFCQVPILYPGLRYGFFSCIHCSRRYCSISTVLISGGI